MFKLCLLILGIALPHAVFGQANQDASSRQLSCEYKSRKHATAGDATISLKNGEIQRLDFVNATGGGAGSPGYTCTVLAERSDRGQEWQTIGDSTRIKLAQPSSSTDSSIVIKRQAQGYRVEFQDALSGASCGAGGELPASVLIPLKGRTCTVGLNGIKTNR